ncbi:hypothetical protein K502DRAFT_347435 [Neoconidiobolus thromboides FSU 785]|nr:hypothetical protein K502DRAFT_347435 [Neoconidiobolus thromboides FSU 785]
MSITREEQFSILESKLGRKFKKVNERILNIIQKKQFQPLNSRLDINQTNTKNNFYGMIKSTPRLISGSFGNAYVVLEVMDLKKLSFVTPMIISLNKRYNRDIDLALYNLPEVLEVILCGETTLLQGNEDYSRPCLFLNSKKEQINMLKIGITDKLKFCKESKCKKIVDSNVSEICDNHSIKLLQKLQGSNMALASGTHTIKLFNYKEINDDNYSSNNIYNTSINIASKIKIHSQYDKIPNQESYLLDNEEIISLYPSIWESNMTMEDLKNKDKKMEKLKQVLAMANTPGGQMARDALKVLNERNKQEGIKKQIDEDEKGGKRSEPFTLDACNAKVKKMIKINKTIFRKESYKPIQSSSDMAKKLEVYDIMVSKEKLKAFLDKGDKKDKSNIKFIIED